MNNFFLNLSYKLSKAKYGFTVVAPTPITVAKECVSKHSPDCTFIETYPLSPNLTKFVWIAPTLNRVGIGYLSSEISLSDMTICVIPCLTAISVSFLSLFKASSSVSPFLKVQSKIL